MPELNLSQRHARRLDNDTVVLRHEWNTAAAAPASSSFPSKTTPRKPATSAAA
jgi:hypothetical protein